MNGILVITLSTAHGSVLPPILSCVYSVLFYLFTPSGPQMTTMEAVESPESLAAVAYLLNLVLKR